MKKDKTKRNKYKAPKNIFCFLFMINIGIYLLFQFTNIENYNTYENLKKEHIEYIDNKLGGYEEETTNDCFFKEETKTILGETYGVVRNDEPHIKTNYLYPLEDNYYKNCDKDTFTMYYNIDKVIYKDRKTGDYYYEEDIEEDKSYDKTTVIDIVAIYDEENHNRGEGIILGILFITVLPMSVIFGILTLLFSLLYNITNRKLKKEKPQI